MHQRNALIFIKSFILILFIIFRFILSKFYFVSFTFYLVSISLVLFHNILIYSGGFYILILSFSSFFLNFDIEVLPLPNEDGSKPLTQPSPDIVAERSA